MKPMGKTALVTGAFEGTGKKIAATLAQSGFKVFGTSRSKRNAENDVEAVQLDLNDPASIETCIEYVETRAGHIDLLVNNAAVTIVAPAEEMPLSLAEDMMQTNYFGVARLVNAVLPGMRTNGGGRLIFVSSIAGEMGVPGQGYYCSTKHALEGYVEGLYSELAKFGIKVTLLQPGSIRTNMIEKSPNPDWPTLTAYDGMREHIRTTIETKTRAGCDPQEIADFVVAAARARNPRLRYPVGAEARQVKRLMALMPRQFMIGAAAKRFGIQV